MYCISFDGVPFAEVDSFSLVVAVVDYFFSRYGPVTVEVDYVEEF